jgi:hypothetical protein
MPEEVPVGWRNRHADCRLICLRIGLVLSRRMRLVTPNETIVVPLGCSAFGSQHICEVADRNTTYIVTSNVPALISGVDPTRFSKSPIFDVACPLHSQNIAPLQMESS